MADLEATFTRAAFAVALSPFQLRRLRAWAHVVGRHLLGCDVPGCEGAVAYVTSPRLKEAGRKAERLYLCRACASRLPCFPD